MNYEHCIFKYDTNIQYMQLCIYMFLRIILLSYVTHHSKFNSGVIANSITQVVRWTIACSNVDDRTQIRLTQPLVHCMSYIVRRTLYVVHSRAYSVQCTVRRTVHTRILMYPHNVRVCVYVRRTYTHIIVSIHTKQHTQAHFQTK